MITANLPGKPKPTATNNAQGTLKKLDALVRSAEAARAAHPCAHADAAVSYFAAARSSAAAAIEAFDRVEAERDEMEAKFSDAQIALEAAANAWRAGTVDRDEAQRLRADLTACEAAATYYEHRVRTDRARASANLSKANHAGPELAMREARRTALALLEQFRSKSAVEGDRLRLMGRILEERSDLDLALAWLASRDVLAGIDGTDERKAFGRALDGLFR